MKFSDVILAVATGTVIYALVYVVPILALIPLLGSYWALNSAGFVSIIVTGLLVGYLFGGKIQEESRMKAVGKIAVLSAFTWAFAVMISFSGNSYYGAWMKENLQSMYSTGAWATVDWFVYEQLAGSLVVALNVALGLVLDFIGLYAGSMLRKPKTS